jgi:hypothetical protein
MRKAFFFRDIAQFTDFVRDHAADSQSKRGFLVYRVRDPDTPAQSLLALVGFRKASRLSLLSSLFSSEKEAMVEEDSAGTHLIQKKRQRSRQQFEIHERLEAHEMIDFVLPKAWKETPEEATMLFRLTEPLLLPRIVSMSLHLGRDRIRVGRLKLKGQLQYFVEIHEPPQFLQEWCLDEVSGQVELWRAHPGQMYTPWGLEFPLQEMWLTSRRSARKDTLFLGENSTEICGLIPWEGVQEEGRYSLELSKDLLWNEGNADDVQLDFPLRLEETPHHGEADVWVLESEAQPDIERLLTLIDERDLESISLMTYDLSPERTLLIVRELATGRHRQYIDFGGQQFQPYKGFKNLLLPTEMELLPSLRRDQYRKLFNLKRGEWTLIWPDLRSTNEDGKPEVRLLRIPESGFVPLQKSLNYLIPAEMETLEAASKGSPFEFDAYLRTMRGDLGLGREVREKKPSEKKNQQRDRTEMFRAAQRAASNKKKTRVKVVPEDQNNTDADRPKERKSKQIRLSELEKEERELQVQLIREGQSFDLWRRLFEVKHELGNSEDAVETGLEALWLDNLPTDEFFRELQKVLNAHLGLSGIAEKDMEPLLQHLDKEFSPHHLVALLFHGRDITGKYRKIWLQRAYLKLREVELKLRKKVRWLLWGEFLQQNNDVRELARVRETLLDELNEGGIQANDIPAFLQTYLTETRHFSHSLGLEGADERLYARQNLELLEDAFEKLSSPGIQAIGFARFAWCFAFIQEQSHAEAVCEQAFGFLDNLKEKEQAWVLLFGLKVFSGTNRQDIVQYQERYKSLMSRFRKNDASTLDALDKMERSLEERRKSESPADFLSRENLLRLEPPRSGQESDEYKEAWNLVEKARKEGNALSVLEGIRHCFVLAEKELERDTPRLNRLFQVVRPWIDTLLKYRGHAGSRDAIEQLEHFTETLPSEPPSRLNAMQVCYFLSLKFRLAKGLLQLNQEQAAVEVLSDTLIQLTKHEIFPVDYIDLCGLAIPAIEVVSLENRQELLTLLTESLVEQLTGKYSFYYKGNESFLPWFLSTLDMLAEAAMSKDQIALELYRQYCDQDELLVRERVLTENLI